MLFEFITLSTVFDNTTVHSLHPLHPDFTALTTDRLTNWLPESMSKWNMTNSLLTHLLCTALTHYWRTDSSAMRCNKPGHGIVRTGERLLTCASLFWKFLENSQVTSAFRVSWIVSQTMQTLLGPRAGQETWSSPTHLRDNILKIE